MPLIIAGLGIKFLSHLTKETEKIIQESDKVLYLANDILFPEWIGITNKNSESLDDLYFAKCNRSDSYHLITQKILAELEHYKNVCFIIYGNPNLLVQVTSLVTSAAENNGCEVYTLPAISSLDCLLADLNINPGAGGMQLFEATELLVYRKIIDVTSHVVIFQPAAIGQVGHTRNQKLREKTLELLSNYLCEFYDGNHQVIIYEASQYPNKKPKVINVLLKNISKAKISSKSTIYISPLKQGEMCQEMVEKIRSIFTNLNTTSKKSGV